MDAMIFNFTLRTLTWSKEDGSPVYYIVHIHVKLHRPLSKWDTHKALSLLYNPHLGDDAPQKFHLYVQYMAMQPLSLTLDVSLRHQFLHVSIPIPQLPMQKRTYGDVK